MFSAVLEGSLKNVVLQFEEKGAAGEKKYEFEISNSGNFDFRGGPMVKKIGV